MIPQESDAEFVAGMEEVLDTYAQPLDAERPVICMDEQPVQFLKETRTPIPATKEHTKQVDYEFERAGVASLFLFCEPVMGWRSISIRERRTKIALAWGVSHRRRIARSLVWGTRDDC